MPLIKNMFSNLKRNQRKKGWPGLIRAYQNWLPVNAKTPIITLKGAIDLNNNAPSIVLWSVIAMQFKPVFKHFNCKASRDISESFEKQVCMCVSTLSIILDIHIKFTLIY